jgi:hypothetical protein
MAYELKVARIFFLLSYGAEFLNSQSLFSHSRNNQHFMEPRGSLPFSVEPTIGLKP